MEVVSSGRVVHWLLLAGIWVIASCGSLTVVGAQTSAFSYQGVLSSGGVPANGAFDLQFSLYDALSGGSQLGSTVTRDDVVAANGVFAVTLDFGADAFDGGERYLGIAVRPGSSTGSYTLLSPRVALNSTPYAVMSLKAASLAGTLPISKGGTGATTAADARTSIGAAASGTNQDITRLSGLTTPIQPLQGGTGIAANPTASGQYLRSAGPGVWAIGTIAAGDIPNLSGSYVDLTSDQTISGNKTFTGTVTGAGTMSWQVLTSNQTAVANRGYIVDSPNSVTISLPANPSVGDVFRINGLGAGGWRLATQPGQSIFTSLDSLSQEFFQLWTARESNRYWRSIASSADGTRLAAVVEDGRIYTSADAGVTWTPRETDRKWISVASSASGSKLVAVVEGGRIYTSADYGVTWTARESDRAWQAVASSADGAKLVALVYGGQIYTSGDSGATWSARETNRNWQAVASSADGLRLAAVVYAGLIYTSVDGGLTWTSRESLRGWYGITSSADGVRLAAVDRSGYIYVSSDAGVSWGARESKRTWAGVASSNDGQKLAAQANNSQIYTSTDSGFAWTARADYQSWNGITSSADGSRLAGVVYGGQIYTNSTSFSMVGGSSLSGGPSSSIELVYIGSGRFLIVSATGAVKVV